MATPLLGWISPELRNQKQQDAHNRALSRMLAGTGLADVVLAKGEKVLLTDSWKHPDVVKALGFEFTGFHQLTGSCVGASSGNWVTTLALIQATLTKDPTQAFVNFWPFQYGITRLDEGDRGQGEGAVDSVMGDTIATKGYFDINQPGLPTFDKSDGFTLTSAIEMAWSDGASSTVQKWNDIASKHKGAKAVLNSTQDIWNAVANGYPVIDGCNDYTGHGSITGSGDTAYVVGSYDGRGGHSTCFLGIWEHPTDGKLFLYSNQWPASTYPKDPAGAGRCCCWMTEVSVAKLFSLGGNGGETMALSHIDWFIQQPQVLDTYV